MASITIRNLDDDVKTRLRVRAAGNGRIHECTHNRRAGHHRPSKVQGPIK